MKHGRKNVLKNIWDFCVQCSQLFARDRAEGEPWAFDGKRCTAQRLKKKKLKFPIKRETRLQFVFDFWKMQFWNFYNFGWE